MAPRSGKRRRRGLPPMPIWLPLHRPCLRSMNVPGAYYVPMPEMYLPPWVLPPPYFSKPMCHCSNDDYCTPNNCRNSADCRKSNPMFCPHGTKDEETDSQQNTIHEEEEEYDPDVDICSSCRAANKKRKMASASNTRQAIGTDPHLSGVTREDSDLNQDKQSSLRDFDKRRENMPSQSIEQGNTLTGKNASRLSLYQPRSECADLSCQTPFNSRDLQANSTSRSSNIQRANTETDVMTDQPIKRLSSGYAADSEPSDTKQVSNGINKVSACTGCSEMEHPAGSPANAWRKNDRQKTDRMHLDQLPDQLAYARKHGNQNTCCISPPASDHICKMQTNSKVGKDDEKRKDSSGSRKMTECGCSSTKLTPSNRNSKPISNMKVANHKATNCECRFPPAFNHLGCSGNRGAAKCICSNKPPSHYSK